MIGSCIANSGNTFVSCLHMQCARGFTKLPILLNIKSVNISVFKMRFCLFAWSSALMLPTSEPSLYASKNWFHHLYFSLMFVSGYLDVGARSPISIAEEN